LGKDNVDRITVTPGGLTDRYLSDYANCYGDLSAGSGLNALMRDEGFTRDFLTRHQDKLVFGSDCSDADGSGPKCQGSRTIATVRRLAGSRAIERKLLFDHAKKCCGWEGPRRAARSLQPPAALTGQGGRAGAVQQSYLLGAGGWSALWMS
jgi:hypothetical protein